MLNKHDIIKNRQIDRKRCLQALFKPAGVAAECNSCVFFTSKSAGPTGDTFMATVPSEQQNQSEAGTFINKAKLC